MLDDDLDLDEFLAAENEDHQHLDNTIEDLEEFLFSEDPPTAKESVKRQKRTNESEWKRNQRKRAREAGQEYVNSKGKLIEAKSVVTRKDCVNNCKYKCNILINSETRQEIFNAFYTLPTSAKYQYILSTSEQTPIQKRPLPDGRPHKKHCTYSYWFYVENVQIRVCKVFYLSTLNIAKKVVYGVYEKRDRMAGCLADNRGKHGHQRRTPEVAKNLVREHIRSFPIVDSHYTRAEATRRDYLDPALSISKMYKLYEELVVTSNMDPVKLSMYSKIFNEEFALSFVMPRKKRCDICLKHEIVTKDNSILTMREFQEEYAAHDMEKITMRNERDKERKCRDAVLCFDVQNVICFPKADISSVYYKNKLNVYLLVAHLSKGNQVYCVLWNEILCDDFGNDLSSAIRLLLDKVSESNKYLTTLTLWTESCLPKSRNPVISYAIYDFLKKHPKLKTITVKYSVVGHTGIQEIYNIQQSIDKVMSTAEFNTPHTFEELLKTVRRKKPYNVIQMKLEQVKNFGHPARYLNFEIVPFENLFQMQFNRTLHMKYKFNYIGDWLDVDITPEDGTITNSDGSISTLKSINDLPEPQLMGPTKDFPESKVESVRSMYDRMTDADKEYFESWFKLIGM